MKKLSIEKVIKERSYLVIEAEEVRTVEEVIRSDGLWHFACGNVLSLCQYMCLDIKEIYARLLLRGRSKYFGQDSNAKWARKNLIILPNCIEFIRWWDLAALWLLRDGWIFPGCSFLSVGLCLCILADSVVCFDGEICLLFLS